MTVGTCLKVLLYGLYVLTVIVVVPGLLYWYVVPEGQLAIPYWIGFTFVAVTNAMIILSSCLAIICCLWRYCQKKRYYVWNVAEKKYQTFYANDLKHTLEYAPASIVSPGTASLRSIDTKSDLDSVTVKVSHDLPRIAIVVSAYLVNERQVIEDTLIRMGELVYPSQVDVILVYNTPEFLGQVDLMERLEALREKYSLEYPNKTLHLIECKTSKSKAENINHILQLMDRRELPRPEYIGIFDADHRPCLRSLLKGIYLLRKKKADILQGRCVILNNHHFLTKLISVELDSIYVLHHKGGELLRGMGFFGGSNGIWSYAALQATKMDPSMLTEDIDSSMRAILAGYKIIYSTDVQSFELAPTTWFGLGKQRLRWSQGWFQVSLKHTLPIICSPYLTCWQKICFFSMLIYREIFYYAASQNWIIFIISLLRGDFLYNEWLTISTGIAMAILPITMLMVWTYVELSPDSSPPPEYKPLTGWNYWLYCLMSIPYSYFLFVVTILSHLFEMIGDKRWRVTARSSSSLVIYPTPDQSV